MSKQYLVPVRCRSDGSFAFMMIIEATSQEEAFNQAHYHLEQNLFIDDHHPFKVYDIVSKT